MDLAQHMETKHSEEMSEKSKIISNKLKKSNGLTKKQCIIKVNEPINTPMANIAMKMAKTNTAIIPIVPLGSIKDSELYSNEHEKDTESKSKAKSKTKKNILIRPRKR